MKYILIISTLIASGCSPEEATVAPAPEASPTPSATTAKAAETGCLFQNMNLISWDQYEMDYYHCVDRNDSNHVIDVKASNAFWNANVNETCNGSLCGQGSKTYGNTGTAIWQDTTACWVHMGAGYVWDNFERDSAYYLSGFRYTVVNGAVTTFSCSLVIQ